MRIAVFGSSVALETRPARRVYAEGNYADLLRVAAEALDPTSEVVNLARRSNLIVHETEMKFTGDLQRLNPQVVILHFGINEAAPRAIPYGPWMWLHGPQDSGRLKAVTSGILLRFWAILIRLLGLRGWVKPAEFGRYTRQLIAHLRKECQAEVFVVNMGPPNAKYRRLPPRIESIMPEYNAVLAKVARDTGAVLVDVWSMVQAEGVEKAQPDGCHLSAYGHRRVFETIWNELGARGLIPAGAGTGRPSVGAGKPGAP